MPGRILPVLLRAALLTVALLALPAVPAQADPLIPLPPPGQPVATDITPTGATLTWTRPIGPVFRYSMQRLVDGEWQGFSSMPFNTVTFVALTPDTEYTVAVRAAALAGSGYTMSPLSEPVTFRTPPAEPAPAWNCTIAISVSQYGSYRVRGTLNWSGPTPPSGWTIRFDIAQNVSITQWWNATVFRTGTGASITALPWDGPAGNPPATQTFDFSGRWTGTFVPPSDFTVASGTPCTILR
ncbi:cellulose binding domain-containing protein [Micromonospora sp. WMMD1102]|uniref:cellulose binding domain-containing protein n=1 Tax=Micromonospora sp. WMMD1102 TaxID=3016105 RepID=UPI00241565AD|nr:fibronectin type III domain-containing protein [Micromonospora sp. WMMD1102]MDG4785223.1 cellulose binding domain-containing protein [Micromonospora sp. WMMD1102]